MNQTPARMFRLWAALVLAGNLAACSSMAEMAKQQDQYKQQRCQQFGLAPGSSAYVQCVSQGAKAYAEAQKNEPAPNAVGAVLIAPAAAAAQNNACAAPASSPKGTCSGCSVSCGAKQASCTPGEEWSVGLSLVSRQPCASAGRDLLLRYDLQAALAAVRH
jgi:hypothetical protein